MENKIVLMYSLNNENFYCYDDISEEIKVEGFDGSSNYIYVGEKVTYFHSQFVDGSSLVEDITNSVYDFDSDFSENYINLLESTNVSTGLEKVVLDYLNKNVEQPDFFGLVNIKKITLREFNSISQNSLN